MKLGILGGGISGLSSAYYVLRQNPKANVLMFEPATVGGWIKTVRTQDYHCEAGPRSFRISEKAIPLLRICEDVGLADKLLYSTTTRDDSEVFTGEKLMKIFPSGSFKLLKLILHCPQYRRFILNNFWTKAKSFPGAESGDLSIRELIENAFNFGRKEDKEFFVDVLTDAFVQGIYSGNISELSARFCFPFSALYQKNVLKEETSVTEFASEFTPWVESVLKKSKEVRSSAMNFKGGMDLLPNTIFNHLQNFPGFSLVNEAVVKVENRKKTVVLHTENKSFEVEHVISTIPSNKLALVLEETCPELAKVARSIPHKSLKTISVGFEKLDLKGVGFLVPTKFQEGLSGALYESCSFPYLKASLSLMGGVDVSDEKMIEIFRKISGCQDKVVWTNVSVCENGLPQYLKGHLEVVKRARELSPEWLSLSGQSFYLSGIPNCINRSHELVSGNSKFI